MASLGMGFGGAAAAATSSRVFAAKATSAKSFAAAGGSAEEKGLFDWILGGLQKEDQLLETDPVLKKVEEKNTSTSSGSRKSTTSVSIPNNKKKFPGFGGLFANK